MHTARWETETRWYEATVFLDLFGTYTVVRSWGGKGSRRHGQLVEVADSEASAQARLTALDKERQRRKPPYFRVV
ncbi:hypothetical protein [Xanthomonas citri]|uniref:hypothetical protein n=1 Tax=Xanthomonas citri TaxID=346 RepID=UPI001CBA9E78|nr:hypothetical protein [Xanthomonas citri]MBZ3928305.1 hypothetical protein [Xanthomonas citri pv. thirumalacharii]